MAQPTIEAEITKLAETWRERGWEIHPSATKDLVQLFKVYRQQEVVGELDRLGYTITMTDKAMGGGQKTLKLVTLQTYIKLRKLELNREGEGQDNES